MRYFSDFVYKNIELPFYWILFNSNTEKKTKVLENLQENLKFFFLNAKIDEFGEKPEKFGGKFEEFGGKIDEFGEKPENFEEKPEKFEEKPEKFGGKIEENSGSLNFLDCIVAPYVLRIGIVLKHFLNFEIGKNEIWEKKFHFYFEKLLKNSKIRETIPNEVEKVWIQSYERYAEGTVGGQLIDFFNGRGNLP